MKNSSVRRKRGKERNREGDSILIWKWKGINSLGENLESKARLGN